jgi:hypothetical protein
MVLRSRLLESEHLKESLEQCADALAKPVEKLLKDVKLAEVEFLQQRSGVQRMKRNWHTLFKALTRERRVMLVENGEQVARGWLQFCPTDKRLQLSDAEVRFGIRKILLRRVKPKNSSGRCAVCGKTDAETHYLVCEGLRKELRVRHDQVRSALARFIRDIVDSVVFDVREEVADGQKVHDIVLSGNGKEVVLDVGVTSVFRSSHPKFNWAYLESICPLPRLSGASVNSAAGERLELTASRREESQQGSVATWGELDASSTQTGQLSQSEVVEHLPAGGVGTAAPGSPLGDAPSGVSQSSIVTWGPLHTSPNQDWEVPHSELERFPAEEEQTGVLTETSSEASVAGREDDVEGVSGEVGEGSESAEAEERGSPQEQARGTSEEREEEEVIEPELSPGTLDMLPSRRTELDDVILDELEDELGTEEVAKEAVQQAKYRKACARSILGTATGAIARKKKTAFWREYQGTRWTLEPMIFTAGGGFDPDSAYWIRQLVKEREKRDMLNDVCPPRYAVRLYSAISVVLIRWGEKLADAVLRGGDPFQDQTGWQ